MSVGRRWHRPGLRLRLAISYVIVTAVSVLVVELLVLGFAVPALVNHTVVQARARTTAVDLASALVKSAGSGAVSVDDVSLADVVQGVGLDTDSANTDGTVRLSDVTSSGTRAIAAAVLLDPRMKIGASTAPLRFPAGGDAFATLPQAATTAVTTGAFKAAGTARVDGRTVEWAVAPIAPFEGSPKPSAAAGAALKPLEAVWGIVYVQSPLPATFTNPITVLRGDGGMVDTRPLIETAIALLIVAIPAGLAFGTLATRRLLRRLRRLGRASLRVADGDFTPRLAPRGVDDEIGRLEANFDTMTARLQDSVEHERELARANATAEERARIARELHDSISQHLFSIRVILAGLHRATSDDEAARRTLVAAERSADDAVREMQALLLELRPVRLEETGLVAALETVFATYRDRLGVAVAADIADVTTDIPVQHAVLRITQEAMTNAVRHGNASVINVNLRSCDGVVDLVVADDGAGFAPAKLAHQGLGLVHMRERAQELGGTFSITSERGSGTAVRVTLPRQST